MIRYTGSSGNARELTKDDFESALEHLRYADSKNGVVEIYSHHALALIAACDAFMSLLPSAFDGEEEENDLQEKIYSVVVKSSEGLKPSDIIEILERTYNVPAQMSRRAIESLINSNKLFVNQTLKVQATNG